MPLFKRTTKAKLHAQQPPIVEPEVIPNSPEPLMQPIAPMSVTANPNTHAAILNRSTADQPASNPQFLMQLQRQYGNRYVNQVVRQFRSPSNPVSAPAVIQPKLTLGAVGDKYEQEADRIAGQVVNQIHHTSSQPIAPGSAVQRERMPEDDEAFQRQPEIGMIQRLSENEMVATPLQGEGDLTTGGTLTPEVEASMNQFSGGQPLPNNLRQSIEQATGANFTSARVYTDNQADALNRSLGSVAATHKNKMMFRQGAYQPETKAGQETIVHEAVHMVQQGAVQQVQRQPAKVSHANVGERVQRGFLKKPRIWLGKHGIGIGRSGVKAAYDRIKLRRPAVDQNTFQEAYKATRELIKLNYSRYRSSLNDQPFDQVWNNPVDRATLREKMEKEHAAENINFLESVDNWLAKTPLDPKIALSIYREYIPENAPQQINLSASICEGLEAIFSQFA